MRMDSILQACMENVLNVLADQNEEDYDDPLEFLSPSLRSKFLRSKKTREMFTGESTAETEERLSNEISDERSRFYQLRETEERLTEELRAMYETQTGFRAQPVAKRRRLNSEPDFAQDSENSDTDFEGILKEEERDLQRCRQQLSIANRQLERERRRNKILEDMLLAIRNRTS